MEAADIQDIPGEYNPGLSSRTKDPGFTVKTPVKFHETYTSDEVYSLFFG